MRGKRDFKGIVDGYVLVKKNAPVLTDSLLSGLKRVLGLCEYLQQEYKKYNNLVIVKEGKSCEFKKFVKLECTPGFVPSYECQPSVEIIKPAAEKAAEILKLALKLGCKWAKDEAKKLGIKIEDIR